MSTYFENTALENRQALQKVMGLTDQSIHVIPEIQKVTINVGLGQEASSKELLDKVVKDIERIAGQKPIVTYAKKSEANFKIRKGWPIGVKVTLRRERMQHFLKNLLYVSMPAQREFNGLTKKSIDRQGNLSFGMNDLSIFRSIPFEQARRRVGMDICVTTSAKTQESGYELLKFVGFPFKENLSGDKHGN